MFWTFAAQLSQIHTLLEQEDCSLQKILSEDDVLQECKVGNKALIEYLSKPEHIKQMLSYIVSGSAEDTDEATQFKFPNIACEILTSGNGNLSGVLLGCKIDVTESSESDKPGEKDADDQQKDEEKKEQGQGEDGEWDDTYLDCLYSFLEQSPPVIPLLASFFSKVMIFLLHYRPNRIVPYLKSKSGFIDRVILHLEASAISDFLIKLICVENKEVRLSVAQWMTSERLIYRLIDGMKPSECDEKHVYISHCLSELISQIRELSAQENEEETADSSMVINNSSPDSTHESTAILDTLESAEVMELLVNNLVNSQKASVIVNTTYIFQTILDNKTKDTNTLSDLNPNLVSIRIDPQRVALATSNLIEACLPHISALVAILDHPPDQFFSEMPTTRGMLSPPLGNSRLQIVRLIQSLIESQVFKIHDALYKEGIFVKLLNLFYQYPFNTFLHKTVVDQIIFITSHSPPKPSSSTSPIRNDVGENGAEGNEENDLVKYSLYRQVIVECQLLDKIPKWWAESETNSKENGQCKRGYCGHLCRLANCMADCFNLGETKALMNDLFKELDENEGTNWEFFVSDTLSAINSTNTIDSSVLTSLNNSIEQEEEYLTESFFDNNSKFEEFPMSTNSRKDDAFESIHSRSTFTSDKVGAFHPSAFTAANFDEDDDDITADSLSKFMAINQTKSGFHSGSDDDREDDEEEDEDEDDLPSPIVIRQNHQQEEKQKKSLPPQDDILSNPPSLGSWGEEKEKNSQFDLKEDLEDDDEAFDTILSDRRSPCRPLESGTGQWDDINPTDDILLDDCKDFPGDCSTIDNSQNKNSSNPSFSNDNNWANFDAFPEASNPPKPDPSGFGEAAGNGDCWAANFESAPSSSNNNEVTSEEDWPGTGGAS